MLNSLLTKIWVYWYFLSFYYAYPKWLKFSKKINIINQCCGLFYDFHFLFQHYQKTFFWFWKTNILQYFPHYFQMLLYYSLLRGIRSKRQRNPGESVWTKWIWNDISKKSWKWVMKPLRCRWKLSTTKFIALQAKTHDMNGFPWTIFGILLLYGVIK